jgi:thioredoxin 1
MKKLLFITPVLIFVMFFIARCEPRREGGIQFYDNSWQEVLNKAKADNKLIFLDIYASWCGPCKMLKRQTFTDKEVGEFYNANFINTSFDGEMGEGTMLARKYKVRGYPTLIIIDGNGQVVNYSVGYVSPRELIKFGKQSLKR